MSVRLWRFHWSVFLCRLNQQQISDLRSQVEELQRALHEQDSKNEDVSGRSASPSEQSRLPLLCNQAAAHKSVNSETVGLFFGVLLAECGADVGVVL